MLAGMMNVSLSWLMVGKGGGPMVHTFDTEMTYLKTSLLALKAEAESTAVQIEELVDRLDELSGAQQDNDA